MLFDLYKWTFFSNNIEGQKYLSWKFSNTLILPNQHILLFELIFIDNPSYFIELIF